MNQSSTRGALAPVQAAVKRSLLHRIKSLSLEDPEVSQTCRTIAIELELVAKYGITLLGAVLRTGIVRGCLLILVRKHQSSSVTSREVVG